MTYEYNTIRAIRYGGEQRLAYESTQDRNLPGLDEANILWIGQEEIAYDSNYLLNKETEDKIRRFVKNGGIVIVSGQDSSHEQPCKTDWVVGKLKGVERPPTQDFKVTNQGRKLFAQPNEIEPQQIFIDDAWTDWDKSYEVLATTNGGKDLAVGLRKHGEGVYIVTSMRNDSQSTVAMNKGLIENLLYYAANWLHQK